MDIHMCHMHKSVLDNVCALVAHLGADTVVKFADDRHQLRNSLVKECDRPLFKCFGKDCMVCISTYLSNDFNSLIHKDASLLKLTDQLRNYHRRMCIIDLYGCIFCKIVKV